MLMPPPLFDRMRVRRAAVTRKRERERERERERGGMGMSVVTTSKPDAEGLAMLVCRVKGHLGI